jgi:hypothetical protein
LPCVHPTKIIVANKTVSWFPLQLISAAEAVQMCLFAMTGNPERNHCILKCPRFDNASILAELHLIVPRGLRRRIERDGRDKPQERGDDFKHRLSRGTDHAAATTINLRHNIGE